MQKLICFSAFLYQYIEFFVFLKVARRGGAIAPQARPLNPPLKPLVSLAVFILGYQYWEGASKLILEGKIFVLKV